MISSKIIERKNAGILNINSMQDISDSKLSASGIECRINSKLSFKSERYSEIISDK